MAAETESSGAMHELDGPLALEDLQPVLAKRAPGSQAERRASFVRYVAAICIGIVGTLAWQSYCDATKQTTATTALEVSWSPDAKLAKWVQQLGWTKQTADLENAALWLSARETPQDVAQVITESLDDAAQRQQTALGLAALRQTVEQIAAGQDKMANEINRLAADVEMLSKTSAHPPQPRVASARKLMPTPPPPSPRPPPPLTLHP
jgi:hypothetical protein